MSWELFQQGPGVYIPVILISLVLTVLAYGAFPLIFAKTTQRPISKIKYRRRSYGINVAVLFLFFFFNGGTLSAGPYLLWTAIFIAWGTRILGFRGFLVENDEEIPHKTETTKTPEEPAQIRFCRKCGTTLNDGVRFCRICGTEIVKEEHI